MAKIELDKYYTSKETAKYCIDKTYEIIGKHNISEIIEPSAGNGSFSLQISKCLSFDIEPEHESITKMNFLRNKFMYKKSRLVIGNPPFGGSKDSLLYNFMKESMLIGDYVSFILPPSNHNNNKYKNFDIIHSELLDEQNFSGVKLRCSFVIYKRSKNFLSEKEKIHFFGRY